MDRYHDHAAICHFGAMCAMSGAGILLTLLLVFLVR